jgi:hypothetical protein
MKNCLYRRNDRSSTPTNGIWVGTDPKPALRIKDFKTTEEESNFSCKEDNATTEKKKTI